MQAACESSPSAPRPARRWQIRGQTLDLGRLPLLMGVVNVTPDSFSDGGRWLEPAAAVDHALALAAAGAEILDLGGESTRPGSQPVDVREELRRVMPVLERLAGQTQVPVSLDTCKAAVAREAIQAGVQIINDISALTHDPAMLDLVLCSGCGVCAMHMQGTPQTMQQAPAYENVVDEVLQYLAARRDCLLRAGVASQRIALDPGIGFGKSLDHNRQLLRNMARFHALGCPVLVGPSRKRFIGQVLGDAQADRTPGTIGVCLALALQGVQILRVHDVAAVRQALQLFDASAGLDSR